MEFIQAEEQKLVDQLLNWGIPRTYQRGDHVYDEGESAKGLYYIKSGLTGLIKYAPNGSENLIRIFKSQQFFGHRSLFSGEKHHGSAKCLEPTEILFCNNDLVFQVFDGEPRSYFFLARALAKELRRAEERSLVVSEGDVIERVSSALLLFKKLQPDHLWTRTEIANYCASRTPTVIKALGQLESQGIIRQQGRTIEIIDENHLVRILNGESK